jgi:2'-hydroxyisoflavone reductase
MELLVLGGTRFVGRAMVEAALERGHRVTLFNRGQTDPNAFPGVERLAGDRTASLDLLIGRRWDAVIDSSGYLPAHVRASAEALVGSVGHYLFVSTISVYADASIPGLDEEGSVFAPDWESTERTDQNYGALKTACEIVVRETYPGRSLIVRPGIIYGPDDYTDRFAYWVRRIRQGGEVLAPGRPQQPLQLIDARDMGQWLVRAAEEGRAGTFNAVGPEQPLTLGGALETVRRATGSDARFTWVDDQFLTEHGLRPWGELPFWAGEGMWGAFQVDNRRAVSAGLTFRPLEATTRDVAAWEGAEHPGDRVSGIPREEEAELLREWHARE